MRILFVWASSPLRCSCSSQFALQSCSVSAHYEVSNIPFARHTLKESRKIAEEILSLTKPMFYSRQIISEMQAFSRSILFSSCVRIRALFPTRRLFLKSQPSINGNSTKSVFNSYAFVEFRDGRDAENAYHDMHGRNFDGHRLSIQWARKPPSAGWRVADGSAPPPRSDRDSRARSRSPRRRSPERRRDRDVEPRDRRRHSSRGRDRDEARTPPPPPYATPMAAGDDHESDRRDTKEYKDSKDSEGDRRGSIRDRRGGSRDRRDRDDDDREARFRREDAGATLED